MKLSQNWAGDILVLVTEFPRLGGNRVTLFLMSDMFLYLRVGEGGIYSFRRPTGDKTHHCAKLVTLISVI